MRIRALQTFTHPSPNGMIVLNKAKGGEKAGEADLPDKIAQAYIDAGLAEGADHLDHDNDGKKGGSKNGADSTAAKGKRAKEASAEASASTPIATAEANEAPAAEGEGDAAATDAQDVAP